MNISEYDTQVIPVNWLAQVEAVNRRLPRQAETQRLRIEATSFGVKLASVVLFVLVVALELLAFAI